MLTLDRRVGECILLTMPNGDQVAVALVESHSTHAKLGFSAPASVNIARAELVEGSAELARIQASLSRMRK